MRILLPILLIMFSLFANENEYILGKVHNSKVSQFSYFNTLGLPDVYVGTQCRKKCTGDNCCWSVIRNQTGKVIKSFSPSDSISTLSNGRYTDVAYLLYSRTYGPSKKRKTAYYLVDQNHKKYDVPTGSTGIKSIISKDKDLISVSKRGVYKNGREILTNKNIEVAKISNNPEGDIAIVAVLEQTDEVIVTNLSKWINTGIVLSQRGDRSGILSVYPKDKNNLFAAVYSNVNIFNKGLVASSVNFAKNDVLHGWIFNSAKRNVGFDPSMYYADETLYIGTKDSTNNKSVYIAASASECLRLGEQIPEHTLDFQEQSMVDLLVGAGLSQTNWYANSEIDDVSSDSDIEYGSVSYDIGASIYKSLYFQGRVNNSQISISYLENEAKKAGGLTAKASKILNVLFDFDGLVSDSSTLRLKVTKGNINGVATFEDKSNTSASITSTSQDRVAEFESELVTYGLYLMKERGYYAGLEYSNYTTPSAVGFSNSNKSMEYYGMDKEFEISTYSLIVGYDEISYAKRYEVDLYRWYIQGFGGIGWANYDLSSQTKSIIKNKTSKKINYTGSVALLGELEVGYIFQQRFKLARGLGYSFTGGYKVRGSYNSNGQTDDSDDKIEANELELEMSRYDIWHGPYVSANFIF